VASGIIVNTKMIHSARKNNVIKNLTLACLRGILHNVFTVSQYNSMLQLTVQLTVKSQFNVSSLFDA